MNVKVSFEILTETRANDKFLREALERMADEQQSESDLRLVSQTFKARMGPAHVHVRRVNFAEVADVLVCPEAKQEGEK